MAEIIKIEGSKVKIGMDDGSVTTVPIASITYANPQVGDAVKVYKDGKSYIVSRESTAVDGLLQQKDGKTVVNKHLFVWVFAFALGGLGVDRFIRGQIGTGICKLIFGAFTLGIWILVDWIIALTKAYGSGNNGEMLSFDENGAYVE